MRGEPGNEATLFICSKKASINQRWSSFIMFPFDPMILGGVENVAFVYMPPKAKSAVRVGVCMCMCVWEGGERGKEGGGGGYAVIVALNQENWTHPPSPPFA